MTTQSQNAQILAYLQAGNTLTPLEALDKFSCFRLGARCWDLKKDGHPIESKLVKVESGARVAEYSLKVEKTAA